MRIATKSVIDIRTGKVLLWFGHDYIGEILNFKASQAEKDLANQQAQFYSTLTNSYKQQFANQSAILSSLTAEFQPILQAGPTQQGWSPSQAAAINTQTTEANTKNFQAATQALDQQIASSGGAALPSGTTEQLRAGLLTSEASQQAATERENLLANYAQGNRNFSQAVSTLTGNARLYDPTGYAGPADTAGTNAFNSANIVQQQNTGWLSTVGGILGGAAGSLLGPIGGAIGGAIGSKLGSAIGGGGSGGGSGGVMDTSQE